MSNKQCMSAIKTHDYPKLITLCQEQNFAPKDIEYVQQHQDDLLSQVLRYLSHRNGDAYFRISETIFKDLHLASLEKDREELIYEHLILSTVQLIDTL